jgi:hypothetical protein
MNKVGWVVALIAVSAALIGGCGKDEGRDQGVDTGWDVGDPLDDAGVPHGPGEIATLVDRQQVQLSNGFSETIDFEVPTGAIAVTVTVEGANFAEMYSLDTWTGPEGTVLIKEGWVRDEPNQLANFGFPTTICHTLCSNRIVASEAAFATIAPNNPEAILKPGSHQIKIQGIVLTQTTIAPSNSVVKVSVHAKIMASEPATGVLDLNIFLTGANGWTAATAPTDPAFVAMLESVDGIYSQVGLSLGEIAYFDVDSRYRVLESIQGATSDMMQMFSTMPEGALNAANLFFVEEIQSPFGGLGGGTILGIAGGIPGPVLVPGTGRSGVAVGTKLVAGGPSLAHVVAHELGHYLGLFHTTENLGGLIGPAHDPLPDTPQSDESYLMHASGAGDKLSPWQGKVMRQNPWVRHLEVE